MTSATEFRPDAGELILLSEIFMCSGCGDTDRVAPTEIGPGGQAIFEKSVVCMRCGSPMTPLRQLTLEPMPASG